MFEMFPILKSCEDLPSFLVFVFDSKNCWSRRFKVVFISCCLNPTLLGLMRTDYVVSKRQRHCTILRLGKLLTLRLDTNLFKCSSSRMMLNRRQETNMWWIHENDGISENWTGYWQVVDGIGLGCLATAIKFTEHSVLSTKNLTLTCKLYCPWQWRTYKGLLKRGEEFIQTHT